MKKNLKYMKILLVFSLLIAVSCNKVEPVDDPYLGSITVVPETPIAGETVTFYLDADARARVFYHGGILSNYNLQDESEVKDYPLDTIYTKFKRRNTGLLVDSDTIEFVYVDPGTYTAVFVLSNFDDFGIELKQVVDSVSVTVVE